MENFEEELKKAEECKNKGDYTGAAKVYCGILSANPSAKDAITGLKDLYVRFVLYNNEITEIFDEETKNLFTEEKYSQAENLAVLISEISKNVTPLVTLGDIYLFENKIDSSIKCYTTVLSRDNTRAECYFNLGIAFSLKGFFDEARDCYLNAIKSDGNNTKYNGALAYLYYLKKDYEKSETIVNKILETDGKDERAIALKIMLSLSAGDIFFAGQYFNRTQTTNIHDDMLYYARAMYLKRMKRFDEAQIELARASEINPASVEYTFESATIYFDAGNNGNCIKNCDYILKMNDKYFQAYILKAKALIAQKSFDSAADVLNKALELDMNSDEAYYLFGMIYFYKNDFIHATENFKAALSVNPAESEYYAKTAVCCEKLSDFRNAGLYYKEAADIDISNAELHYKAAKCFEKIRFNEEAALNFATARRLDTFNCKYIEDYVMFLCRTGKRKKAQKLLKTAEKEALPDGKERLKIIAQKIKNEKRERL